jgi:hypothetical protein
LDRIWNETGIASGGANTLDYGFYVEPAFVIASDLAGSRFKNRYLAFVD